MDLNLVDKQENIVAECRLLPDIYNLCTMSYNIETKTALAAWQHGLIAICVIESIEVVYNPLTCPVLFVIDQRSETRSSGEQQMLLVEFHCRR